MERKPADTPETPALGDLLEDGDEGIGGELARLKGFARLFSETASSPSVLSPEDLGNIAGVLDRLVEDLEAKVNQVIERNTQEQAA